MYLHTHFEDLPLFVHAASRMHGRDHLRMTLLERADSTDRHRLKIELFDCDPAYEESEKEPRGQVVWEFDSTLDLLGMIEGLQAVLSCQLRREERGLALASQAGKANRYWHVSEQTDHANGNDRLR